MWQSFILLLFIFCLFFMQVSRLVVSEIVSRQNLQERVSCIEKWAAIADICRCMHNYNGVLQICAAFVNSSVYRLKKTWEKLSKQVSYCTGSSLIQSISHSTPLSRLLCSQANCMIKFSDKLITFCWTNGNLFLKMSEKLIFQKVRSV